MLIKTTKDDADHHFFMGFSDKDDNKQDHSITEIYYKTWAFTTANQMMNLIITKKQEVSK